MDPFWVFTVLIFSGQVPVRVLGIWLALSEKNKWIKAISRFTFIGSRDMNGLLALNMHFLALYSWSLQSSKWPKQGTSFITEEGTGCYNFYNFTNVMVVGKWHCFHLEAFESSWDWLCSLKFEVFSCLLIFLSKTHLPLHKTPSKVFFTSKYF